MYRKKLFLSELERRVQDGAYTERQDGGRVPPKKWKAKVVILKKYIFYDCEPASKAF